MFEKPIYIYISVEISVKAKEQDNLKHHSATSGIAIVLQSV